MERETGFEPATSTLARSHSTTELFPLARPCYTRPTQACQTIERARVSATGLSGGAERVLDVPQEGRAPLRPEDRDDVEAAAEVGADPIAPLRHEQRRHARQAPLLEGIDRLLGQPERDAAARLDLDEHHGVAVQRD